MSKSKHYLNEIKSGHASRLGSGIACQAWLMSDGKVVLDAFGNGSYPKDYLCDIAGKSPYLPQTFERLEDTGENCYFLTEYYPELSREIHKQSVYPKLWEQYEFLEEIVRNCRDLRGNRRVPQTNEEINRVLRATPTRYTRLKYALRLVFKNIQKHYKEPDYLRWDLRPENVSVTQDNSKIILRDLLV